MSLASTPEVATPLRYTLGACVPDLHRHCRDSWVVIDSAARCLFGRDKDLRRAAWLTTEDHPA